MDVSKATLVRVGIGVVLVNTAMVGASAVGTLVAAAALGETWSGAPNAASVLGTALGALSIGALMARRGRRTGLLVAYAVAALGAGAAGLGVVGGSLGVLTLGMLLLGVGNAAAQLARYVVAEVFPPQQRGSIVGTMVWAGSVGAVVGPNVLGPSATLAMGAGLPPLAGVYVLALVAMAGAALAALGVPRGPAERDAVRTDRSAVDGRAGQSSITRLVQPRLAHPLAAMVAANCTMVLVMTMTPLHVQLHGQGLGTIGAVISAHMLGMFALAPLAGRLADWRGGHTVVRLGAAVLVLASTLAAVVDPTDSVLIAAAVFLLGFGWNLCWVGGSSVLAREVSADAADAAGEQVRVQADADAIVWSTSTVASLAAGALLASGGFALVACTGAAVALLPSVIQLAIRGRSATRLHDAFSTLAGD